MDHLDLNSDRQMRWGDYITSRLIRVGLIFSSLVSLSVVCIVINAAERPPRAPGQVDEAQELSEAEAPADQQTQELKWFIPEPLPFPVVRDDPSLKLKRFELSEAGIGLSVLMPPTWKKISLDAEDQLRFHDPSTRDEYVKYSAGCFGSCDTLEENIAESLTRRAQRDYHKGLDPRVVHWHVHHKTWVEYSLLYRDLEGDSWLVGVSTRWSDRWLYALRCEYRAPIELPYERQEVLHLAWDVWAPQFIRFCRQYEVTSWE